MPLTLHLCSRRALAERVSHDGSDPWRPVTELLAATGPACDGRAHVDLVQTLHTAGDAPGAFRACPTAAFWTFRSRGHVPAELHLLASRLASDLQKPWPIVARNLRAMGTKI
jgi:hypothetical protein